MERVNPLPHNQISDVSKLKAFENIVTQKLEFVQRKVENIVGIGENAFFSFFRNISYHSQNEFSFLVTFILSSANAFNSLPHDRDF